MLRNRLERDRARDDTRQWVQDRRARTRHLIELGGLVQKAGLVELLDDDRATLLGAFLGLADQLQEEEHQGVRKADLLARWRRRGMRVFETDVSSVPGTTQRLACTGNMAEPLESECRESVGPRYEHIEGD